MPFFYFATRISKAGNPPSYYCILINVAARFYPLGTAKLLPGNIDLLFGGCPAYILYKCLGPDSAYPDKVNLYNSALSTVMDITWAKAALQLSPYIVLTCKKRKLAAIPLAPPEEDTAAAPPADKDPLPAPPPSLKPEPLTAFKYIKANILSYYSRPATGAALALTDLPLRRDLVSNKASRGAFSTKKPANVPATIVQLIRDKVTAPCNRYAKSNYSLYNKNRVLIALVPPAANPDTLPGSASPDLVQLKEHKSSSKSSRILRVSKKSRALAVKQLSPRRLITSSLNHLVARLLSLRWNFPRSFFIASRDKYLKSASYFGYWHPERPQRRVRHEERSNSRKN
ncbi:hypothetical protein ACRALDRAFT_1069410 [Sodiomyces alcalophilus JCM 7366]|uniref:uncharacterized protein n=1 Tax=Sodiomyces alcalophilus JCM 7366 TaxID=591952 RepID=UPI0039B53292